MKKKNLRSRKKKFKEHKKKKLRAFVDLNASDNLHTLVEK
jgi:hypothetical protein